jgi:hypothetical protein
MPRTAPVTLLAFFEGYAAASQNEDPRALACLYAPTFIVGGPKGSQAFANDDKFLEWIHQVRAFNQRAGMTSLVPIAVEERTLSPIHSLATVTWSSRFARTGDKPIDFRIAYLVETADSPKILAYVSEADQADEMKRQGLM